MTESTGQNSLKPGLNLVTEHVTEAKSLLRRHSIGIDSWFLASAGMNIYRGCIHDCAYCDGRAEKYRVEGEFGRELWIKANAPVLLRKELTSLKKRGMLPGFVIIGGGVGDSYNPLEEKYRITRACLEILLEFNQAVHLLTKSALAVRDIDLIAELNRKNAAIVSFSLSTADDAIAAIFEPGASPPSERLNALARFKQAGLHAGIFFMPVIPLVTDSTQELEKTMKEIAAKGGEWAVFGGMTLKEGRQKEHFLTVLDRHYPGLSHRYAAIYPGLKWGNAASGYYGELDRRYLPLALKYKIPPRIPVSNLPKHTARPRLLTVILEQIAHLFELEGRKSSLGRDAWVLAEHAQELEISLFPTADQISGISGVSAEGKRLAVEILETGRCTLYETLIGKYTSVARQLGMHMTEGD